MTGNRKLHLGLVLAVAALGLFTLVMAPMMMVSTFPSITGGELPDCDEALTVAGKQSETAASDIPADYLKLYRENAEKVGVQWNVLAGVGKRETDHGRSTLQGVQSGTNYAGAAGPMQFLISTWGGKAKIKIPSQFNGYASDGDGDGWGDVYNPADAILGAAKMLKRNGAPEDVRRSLFVYNRAWWYVDQVMEIAKKYAEDGEVSVPPEAEDTCDEPLVEAAPTETVAGILEYALAQRGKPYLWGGTGPDAFDCSGIIYMAYRSVGLTIPRTTFGQWPFGVKITPGEEQAGDLVFFNSGPGTGADRPGHVGMVVSPGKMVEARCRLCGPIKVTSYQDRLGIVGFTRPLRNPDVLQQLKLREQG
ncbi:bifunctional lytic transglycosylase/C40 family peptidase [Streptosporangium sp. NBC_01639]|uniref:C40 family peptidase n=1 Tax=unclassified Streptosporangium TaxID=2632669 RepID=UPI002DD7A7EA|nr:bifunctional lytic transglycosylase/C40 family peptidase [Streptosporangium sp. NBC_01756]WSC89250.1 bifunctional lytic transglycosylase/C40 family peptidase [Streptosporangium sp. NBC_01756]WTD52079.1 bifunctional lytic transglycosylase/C40 family peptidase [Streptosporangium sp. NBC_01639]